MRTLVITFLAFCLFGCNNQEKKRIEQNRIDSIALAEKRSIEIADSIKAAMLQEQSLVAWGDAKFGMSQKEVLKTKAFEGSSAYDNWISLPYKNYRRIGGTEIGFSNFHASFKINELYRIDFRTPDKTANYIDDLQGDAQKISYQFEKKYGDPEYSLNKEISIFDFNNGKEFDYKSWKIGDKYIYIIFGEVDSGSEYYYRVVIFNNNFPTKEDPEEIAQKEQKEKEQEEKAKYQF